LFDYGDLPDVLTPSLAWPKTAEAKGWPLREDPFSQRCDGLGIKGVSLHSYRYSWAERARIAGMPERFAQETLGHNSKAVHRSYASKAKVIVPSLEQYEKPQVSILPAEAPLQTAQVIG